MDTIEEPIRFRAGKKRKTYRQRVQDEGELEQSTLLPPPPPPRLQTRRVSPIEGEHECRPAEPHDENGNNDSNDQGSDDDVSSVSAVLRTRRVRRPGFRSHIRAAAGQDLSGGEQALVVAREQDQLDGGEEQSAAAVVVGIADRFTHQTGLVPDFNDRHMYVPQVS